MVSDRNKGKKRIWVEAELGEMRRHYLIFQYPLSRLNNNFSYIPRWKWNHTMASEYSLVFAIVIIKFNQPAAHSNWAFICNFIWAKSILKNFRVSNQPNLSPLSKQLGSTASGKSLFLPFFLLLCKTSFSQRRKVCHKNKGVVCLGSVWIQVWQQYCVLYWFLSC